MKQRYWICIIGPVPDADLPNGADNPPRRAAILAVDAMLPKDYDFSTSSGWYDEETYLRVVAARESPKTPFTEKNQ